MPRRGIHRRLRLGDPSLDFAKRFWEKVHVGELSECWPWLGCLRSGYGAIGYRRRVYSAHVVAKILSAGREVPDGFIVTHDCDNRLCCNPSHLRFGTPRSNARELFERNAPQRSKVTTTLVRTIRSMYAAGHSINQIAAALDRPRTTVGEIARGKRWCE